jgi:hypothetical protein
MNTKSLFGSAARDFHWAAHLRRTASTGHLIRTCVTAFSIAFSSTTLGANLLVNGDFEAAPILGVGQTAVPIGSLKAIQTNPAGPLYSSDISGISSWTYATPNDGGTASDHGLARRNAEFGLPASGQSAFINNWNRMMSQTAFPVVGAGDTAIATIDFGTLGSDTDPGRAGEFYLVAGEASASDHDQFSMRSIILDQLSVANPTWTQFTPNVTVGNDQYVTLHLSYTYQPNDPALGLPLTIAFRTVTDSFGQTYWDNATLAIQPVPEPGALLLAALGWPAVLFAVRRRRGFPTGSGPTRSLQRARNPATRQCEGR